MLAFKVVFWIMSFGVVYSFFNSLHDHPRRQNSVNTGTDIMVFLIRLGMAVWLYISIWGNI